MKPLYSTATLFVCLSISANAQNVGVNTSSPVSRLHVNGTAWFQGDNTPLSGAAGSGIGIGFTPGATAGYIFGFNYSTFTPRDLWLQSPGGDVVIGSQVSDPLARLHIVGSGNRAVYISTNVSEAVNAVSTGGHSIVSTSLANIGVYGVCQTNSAGLFGESKYIGVQGFANGTVSQRQGVRGEVPNDNVGGYAGIFVNSVTAVFGTLTKTAGAFLIDHPTEPDTKFLYHSFVESPDMKNIYDGVVTTDGVGQAVVTMPSWFQALNMDYRYQLTCLGQFAQAIVMQEITGNQFVIKTDKPNVKVSWQVTGTRNDPWARDNRIPLEKAKNYAEIGKYIYPQGYGKSSDKSLDILKPTNLVKAGGVADY